MLALARTGATWASRGLSSERIADRAGDGLSVAAHGLFRLGFNHHASERLRSRIANHHAAIRLQLFFGGPDAGRDGCNLIEWLLLPDADVHNRLRKDLQVRNKLMQGL